MNKTADEIVIAFNRGTMVDDDIREMIRFYFSRNLIDTNETNAMPVFISFGEDKTIDAIYQDPCEGYIIFVLENGAEVDFDDIDTDDLVQIIKDFETYYE